MYYYRLYIEPSEPRDAELVELFKKAKLYGSVVPSRICPDSPELIRESPLLCLVGWDKITEYLEQLISEAGK